MDLLNKLKPSSREASLGIILLIAIGVTGLINPRFLTGDGTKDLLTSTSVVALLAIGIAPVVVMRHIDLSIASTVGLTAWLIADICAKNPDFTWVHCFIIGPIVGALVGVLNGLLVAGLRLPSLVVTLGTLYIVRGLVYVISNSVDYNAQELPPSLIEDLGQKVFFGLLPFTFSLVIIFMVLVAYFMKYAKSGRDAYAIGSNPPAADLVGLKVFRRTFLAFVFSGTMAGLAAVFYLMRFAQVDSTAFYGQELAVVAACVIGGVSIFGGTGTVVGAVIGALLVQTIQGGLAALGVDAFWKSAINGLLLVIAIYADRVLAVRSEKRLLQQRIRERT
ncbi:MAG: ABC transporter permease [Actinomycetota bacterium]|nr:ABC transporter permease [Actinomycetota bacterium]MDA2997925.1 ABC transporter permease [Actinomycetota bacterium]MDA3036234.1 ABC transporter permease [Actinomycetota bacterium]